RAQHAGDVLAVALGARRAVPRIHACVFRRHGIDEPQLHEIALATSEQHRVQNRLTFEQPAAKARTGRNASEAEAHNEENRRFGGREVTTGFAKHAEPRSVGERDLLTTAFVADVQVSSDQQSGGADEAAHNVCEEHGSSLLAETSLSMS